MLGVKQNITVSVIAIVNDVFVNNIVVLHAETITQEFKVWTSRWLI